MERAPYRSLASGDAAPATGPGGVRGRTATALPVRLERADRPRQVLRLGQHRAEELAQTLETLGHVLQREVRGVQVALELVPRERRRDRRAAHRAHDVRRHHRLALAVLSEVDVDLAAALGQRAFDRRDLGQVARHDARHALGEQLRVPVGVARREAHEDVQARGARGLEVRLQADAAQEASDLARDADHVRERRFLRVEVDHRPVGRVLRVDARHPRMQIDAAEVHEVQQRVAVVAHHVAQEVATALAADLDRAHPLGRAGLRFLLVEGLAGDAVREAVEVDRPVAQVRQEHLGHLLVVAEQVALGEALGRPVDLVEVAEGDA